MSSLFGFSLLCCHDVHFLRASGLIGCISWFSLLVYKRTRTAMDYGAFQALDLVFDCIVGALCVLYF